MEKSNSIQLVKPVIKYKKSFIQGAKEFQKEGRNVDLDIEDLDKNFDKFVTKLLNEELGIGLKDGYIPASTLWLIDNDEFIGKVSIRHTLTEKLLQEGGHIGYEIRPSKRKMGYGTKILALAVKSAKNLGIEKILVT